MSDQQEEPEEVYVEHQYMCSECHQLFNTLEEVLLHQQSHTGPEEAEGGGPEDGDTSYQCLECGALLRNPEELLLHQEMHMSAGLEAEHEVCEVLEAGEGGSDPDGPIQYQCLECLQLFNTPELWLQHTHTHQSNTHSAHSNTEYVVQADGSVAPLVNVQNLVLDEQRAGEILAQVLAQQQQQTGTSSRALLPPVAPLPGSATLRLQICSAQALADAHTHTQVLADGSTPLRRARLLPPLLTPTATPTLTDTHTHTATPTPYECSECALEFATPEDFLAHQGEHFLCQEKESGDGVVVMDTPDMERTPVNQVRGPVAPARQPVTGRSAPEGGVALQCAECQRTFTSANRLAAHGRVHQQGTHQCPECDKVFKKAGSLHTHLRTHSGEARYLCVDCGHGFTTEMTLIIHRKSHTAEPLHRCEFCSKTFTNMTKFLYHRRTHTARTPLTPVSTVCVPSRRLGPAPSLRERLLERQGAGLTRVGQSERQVTGLTQASQSQCQGAGLTQASQSQCQGAGRPQVGGSEVGLIAPLSEAELEAESCREADAPVDDRHGDVTKENGVGSAAPPTGQNQESVLAAPAAELSFPCPTCGKAFSTALRLVRHRRTVHVSERLFRCGVCAKPFKKQIHVRNHLRTHTGERPFQCSDCGKTFSSLANLSRHTLTHTGERPYRCPVCPRAFSQSSNLRQHQLLHADAPPCRCPDCPATFRRPAKLTAHRYTRHQGPAPYPCPHCPQGFLRKRLRDLHCHSQHPTLTHTPQHSALIGPAVVPKEGEEPEAQQVDTHTEPGSAPRSDQARLSLEDSVLIGSDSRPSLEGSVLIGSDSRPSLDCNICGKRLNSASNLRLHVLSHTGMGPGRGHVCGVCGKSFASASGLTLHRRVHTGERPFPCGVCAKRFRQNTHLREHLRTHSGERPFRCDTCGKGFVQSMHLAEHRRTHTGERPHACQCGKAFKTVSNLRNHQKIHTRALQQQERRAEEDGHGDSGEAGAAVAVLDGSVELTAAVPALCQQGALGQPQLIQIQTADLAQGTPTIMCNEFGEAIAIIETSEGAVLPLAEALEIYQTALESSLGVDAITVDSLQLL
ncbi:zinc finger protein 574 isoform X2 [Alosa alosa]|uniref:zinc finger protein 574 isoform X2 n=1 Tax=Alosa alosa TaxID=278164 RepID=UPI0020152FAC|nr:zinc finger protein 574 isoform X2 [Alosa alosa]